MQELDGWLAYRFIGPTPSSIGTKKKNGFGVAVFLIIVLLLLGYPHRPSLRQIFMFFIFYSYTSASSNYRTDMVTVIDENFYRFLYV